MSKIETLTIEFFRGSTIPFELEFDKKKGLVLIFGENGSGKTTIVDALDAVGNLSKGSLEDRSSTRGRNHLTSLGKEPQDVKIEIKTTSNVWKASLKGKKIESAPTPLPTIRVLRRGRLLRLIEAQPAKRYEELKHFIEVDHVEGTETALKQALNEVKTEINQLAAAQEESESGLVKIWESHGAPGVNYLDWIQGVANIDVIAKQTAIAKLKNTLKVISQATRSKKSYRDDEAAFLEKNAALKAVELEVSELPLLDGEQTINLVDLLKKTQDFFETGNSSDLCPVCEQEISLTELKQNVKRRLAGLDSFRKLGQKRKNANLAVNHARTRVQSSEKEIYQSILALQSEEPLLDIFPIEGFPEIDRATPTLSLDNALDYVDKAAEKENELVLQERQLTEESGMVGSIRVFLEKIEESKKNSQTLIQIKDGLEEAYRLMQQTRIEFTQDILDDITDECNRLYEIIHPGESIGLSKIEMDKAKRASLNQLASFEGHNDLPPQAYFSESHLDTLGFCLWLALAKRECPDGNAVVVLDDIFTSVDSQHINRIAQLIADESAYFAHIIVTTHQRLWRDFYKYQKGPGNKADMIELQGWSMATGISSYQTRLAVHDLAGAIEAMPFDRQVMAQKAGILLEAILDYLALKYRCRLPRSHDNSYTLGELMDGTKSLFKQLKMYRPVLDEEGEPGDPSVVEEAEVTDIINQLGNMTFIRNQVGAHFNVSGMNIPDRDIKLFGELTVSFAGKLSCNVCGQIPAKSTGTHFKCSCQKNKAVLMGPLYLV